MRARTTLEIKRAAALWSDGLTAKAIGAALGRSEQGVKYMIVRNRALFPRRKLETGHGRSVKCWFALTPFLDRAIKAEAKARGIKPATLIREALRDRFIRQVARRAA